MMRPASPDSGSDAYFRTRFAQDERRDQVWRRLVAYLSRWVPTEAAVADVGAGYCSFINVVAARRRVAVDVNPTTETYADDDVEFCRASATDLPLGDAEFDVVFASNLLEHLERPEITRALAEFLRVLKPGGKLLLIQPNFRLCVKRYYDDYTHLTPLSDVSLGDLLRASGYRVERVEARFLPFSLKSRLGKLSILIPFYLRLPWRPFAGQMLLVASREDDHVA